jgi:FMN-dependent oxidoreductase (nitrilotriacetate monooxygenase family)
MAGPSPWDRKGQRVTTPRKLHIGMSLTPTWLSGNGWRRPDSGIDGGLTTDFFLDIAKRAEAAKLDFVFRADTLFVNTALVGKGGGFGGLDSTLLMAALARETTHIGLLSTVSTMFMPPYILARQIMSLHWLSNGRAGWNIVTALDGYQNFGLESMPSSQERYARAAECTEVVRLLWQSFPDAALLRDRESGRFTDPAQVKAIDHVGPHFQVKGPLNVAGYSRAPVPLVQAGASEPGREFATQVADAIFASTPDMEAAVELRHDLRSRAQRHGRNADDIRLLPGLSLYLADSRGEAFDLFEETHAGADRARKIAHIRTLTGLDLETWPDDQRVQVSDLPMMPPTSGSRTHGDLLRRLIAREPLTVAELLNRPEVNGSGHWRIIGTIDDAATEIMKWTEAGAIDGFVLTPGGSTGCMHMALAGLMPRLSDMGLLRRDYTGHTFFHHLSEY